MVVESVAAVRSVDLVDQPATNAGLFESAGRSHFDRTFSESLDAFDAEEFKQRMTKVEVKERLVVLRTTIDEIFAQKASIADIIRQTHAAMKAFLAAVGDDAALQAKPSDYGLPESYGELDEDFAEMLLSCMPNPRRRAMARARLRESGALDGLSEEEMLRMIR